MCFSSTASFGASALLSVAGVISVSRATSRQQAVLAAMPFVFAAQQFSEGILWMSLKNASLAPYATLATHVFLLFAQVIWPIFVPFSVHVIEKSVQRKKVMSVLMVFGLLLAVYLGYCLLRYPVSASIAAHHIHYDQSFPLAKKKYFGLLYFIPTILAPLLSSYKPVHLIGYLFFAGYVISFLFFHFFLISVWCFFGAMISLVVIGIVSRQNVSARLLCKQ